MRHQRLDGAGRDAADGAAEFQRGLFHEASREHREVLTPLAQRRNGDRELGEAIVEVGAEAGGGYAGLQLFVGGGNQANIEGRKLDAAERAQLALLDHAQQLDLGGGRKVANLVKEQRTTLGGLEIAGLLAIGAGESALMIAE